MIRPDYLANYDQIARDHVAHWRQTGENPWQPRSHVELVMGLTVEFVTRYSQPGDPVLDAGCGMGDLLSRLPDRTGFGCDFSREYVAIAQGRGINAIYGELEALPYPDAQFAVVVATDVLEHVLDLNVVIREFLRVLRPGGVLVVRSPDSEDLTPYLAADYPYRFVHLRRFDEPSMRLLFDRVFDCDVLEVRSVFGACAEITVAVRKRT